MRRVILSISFLGMFFAFGYMFHVQYFRWRGCFNELGRCFDSETGVVYLEQSGAVWLLLAIMALALSLLQTRRLIKDRR